ncbi:hypothetical protein SMC26_34680, partial [Actinomadura fulvescens]
RYGPLDALWAAIRRRVPHIAGECVDNGIPNLHMPGVPRLFMRVSYNGGEPRRVVWEEQIAAFAWNSGPDAGVEIGPLDDVDRVAEAIGRALVTSI